MLEDLKLARRILRDQSDYEGAIEIYTELIRDWPRKASLRLMRAELLAKTGETKFAIRDVTKAIRLRPNECDTYRFRAILYLRVEKNSRALADASRMVKLSPPPVVKAMSHQFRASVLLRLGEGGEAIEEMNAALILQPQNADLWRFRAGVRSSRWDLKGAVLDYTMAIRVGEAGARDYYDRGIVNEFRGNVVAALQDYKKASHLEPAWEAIRESYHRLKDRVLRQICVAS